MGSVSGSLPTVTFTGQSTYSASLQAQLNQALDIAALPIQQMQQQVSGLQSQQQALTGLQSAFGSLQNALQSISTDSAGTLSANSSDPSAVSASASASAFPGTYSIQVSQVGTPTQTLSSTGLTTVTDPTTGNISSASSFTLTVNSSTFTITPAANNLEALATAINNANAGVQATVVNVGGSSADYRLSVTSSNAGATSIQLSDGTNPLLTTLATGTDSAYTVDGSGTPVQSSSNQITLAPGLTVNLLQASSTPVTITVGADYSALSNDLSNFVSAYNNAVTTADQEIGQNAGPLAGQSIVYSLTGVLNNLVNYTNGFGAVNSLASLGVTMGSDGQLSFNSTTFNTQDISQIQQFLGGATTGGFLQTAVNALTGVADPSSGDIQSEFNLLQTEVTNDNTQISNQETRVQDLQTNLTQQLSQADATIANLQAQTTYYTQLFNAEYNYSNTGNSSSGG